MINKTCNRLITASVFCLLLSACQQNDTGNLVVEGHIKNAAGKKVLLAELPYGSPTRTVVDSTTLLSDSGNFRLQTLQTPEGIYQLFVENGPGFLLINDADNIKIEADARRPQAYSVQGSAATRSIIDLYTGFTRQYETWKTSLAASNSLMKTSQTSDSLQLAALGQSTAARAALENYLKEWLTTSNNATARMLGLGLAKNYLPATAWQQQFDAALEAFPRHAGLQKMKVHSAGTVLPGEEWVGRKLPAMLVMDTSGKAISLNSFNGRWLLIDFWASWCKPCREESPNLRNAFRQYNKRGLSIVSISLDKDAVAWKNAIVADSLFWTNAGDTRGWESPVARAFDITALPFNLLVDPSGNIRAANLRGDSLQSRLAQYIR
jgi:thiol-disulfide isomerase/thioredoxin